MAVEYIKVQWLKNALDIIGQVLSVIVVFLVAAVIYGIVYQYVSIQRGPFRYFDITTDHSDRLRVEQDLERAYAKIESVGMELGRRDAFIRYLEDIGFGCGPAADTSRNRAYYCSYQYGMIVVGPRWFVRFETADSDRITSVWSDHVAK